MKTKNTLLSVLSVCFLMLVSCQTAFGQANDIKARMAARLPEIVALKVDGIIGEDNKGYLAYPTSKVLKKDIVDGENNDRRQVYSAIAKQQGTTAEVVGVLRAKKIAEKAKSGEWIQDEGGKWMKK
jgi:hypothetical protein